MKKFNWRNWVLPILHFELELPFIHISTAVMNRVYETDVFQYIVMRVKIYKWGFEFELYDTGRRRR